MIIAIGILVFMAVCALSLIGLGESHSRVSRILTELDYNRLERETESRPLTLAAEPEAEKVDVFQEVAFTRSLLALGRVRSQDPYEAPVLEPGGSSSLESVPLARSKNRARAL